MNDIELKVLVEKGIEDLGYSDCFYIEHKITGTKVEVFMDSDTGVTFEKCQKISRYIEAVLDETKSLGESYTLEVSSSGIGRPLIKLRQYLKNIGRIIDIKHLEGEQIRGVLKSVNDNLIEVEFETKIKEGKKNKTLVVQKQIKFEDIVESKIKVNFN